MFRVEKSKVWDRLSGLPGIPFSIGSVDFERRSSRPAGERVRLHADGDECMSYGKGGWVDGEEIRVVRVVRVVRMEKRKEKHINSREMGKMLLLVQLISIPSTSNIQRRVETPPNNSIRFDSQLYKHGLFMFNRSVL